VYVLRPVPPSPPRSLRVLTWNLYHGRAVPAAGRQLFPDYTAALAGWEWDVALLQEVPPWWPERWRQELRVETRSVLTSRNGGLAARRAAATRWPDLLKSNGGGANAILVRPGRRCAEHRSALLRRFPERRRLHAVRLNDGTWIGNLHAQGSRAEALRAGEALRDWAGAAPVVLGGDFNLPDPQLPRFTEMARHGVDMVLARGLKADGPAAVLERGRLSDHAPLAVSLTRGSGPLRSGRRPS
jgi:endonuclease/exonuclease/phosphatase family metal-dependent hydrolase